MKLSMRYQTPAIPFKVSTLRFEEKVILSIYCPRINLTAKMCVGVPLRILDTTLLVNLQRLL